ncbi:class I SAM-dependent methyltransferase [Streptomyces sp. NPDC054855]
MTAVRETSTPEYWNDHYEAGRHQPRITGGELNKFNVYVGPKSGMAALDAGCGRGKFAAYLGTRGLDVLGLDFAARAVDEARRGFEDRSNVTFDLHDFNAGPIHRGLKPGSINIIVCRLSLAHMDRERFLVDARRWLTPDGVLHITTHVVEHAPGALHHCGLTSKAVDDLETGWERATRYHLKGDGSLTCLALRGPYPAES